MTEDYNRILDAELERLIELVRANHIVCDEQLVREAFAFARDMHGEQKRESGEPFVMHPLKVAQILAEVQMDQPSLIAALLHDCLEDTAAGYDQVAERFTPEVAMLVDGVTKLDGMEFRSKDEAEAESLRKMMVAMAKDMRVVIIKLADRLHNMRTLRYRDENKRIATARETLEIYAPLAHRLGIYAVKWELEDLSFRFLEPDAYFELEEKVNMKRGEREAAIGKIIGELREKLREANIEADIDGRPKHFYSIYRKMQTKGLTFEQIYDLIAVRVIVEEIRDCYNTLGIVHSLWKPMQGRFKDYIYTPKPNLYQSLHTTVISDSKLTFEVQIRTKAMHQTAEYGVAAHWRYKEGGGTSSDFDQRLAWLRQVNEAQAEGYDSSEFLDMLKVDLFSDEVFVHTPKGDVIDLPVGATPLDFAYRIHSQVGNRCVGAKINNRIVTLDTPLQTGDIIEIMTSSSSKGPSRDWLKIVKTTQARSKIRAALKQNLRSENIQVGKDMIERDAKRQGIELNKLLRGEGLANVLKRLNLHNMDDLYATVGFGGLHAAQVIARLEDEYRKINKIAEPPPPPPPAPMPMPERAKAEVPEGDPNVSVKGMDNMLTRYAKCCTPVPGDEIIGYITRGRGVSVHRADCINMIQAQKNPMERARLIEVSWTGASRKAYDAEIQIIGYDRVGLLANVTNIIAKQNVPLTTVSARVEKDNTNVISLTLEIEGTKQLDQLIAKLQACSDVIEVYRGSREG